MRKLAAGLAVVTATALPMVAFGPSPAASATAFCEYAEAHGTVVGMWVAGPYCVPYNNATFCEIQDAGFGQAADVYVKACIPAPVLAGETEPGAGEA